MFCITKFGLINSNGEVLTDLIYEYWNHGGDGQNDFSRMNWSNNIKKQFWKN